MMDGMAILAAAAAPAPGGLVGGLGGMLVPMVLIFAIFYFMLIRPQQRKDKERRDLVDNVKTAPRSCSAAGFSGR